MIWTPLIDLARNIAKWAIGLLPVIDISWAPDFTWLTPYMAMAQALLPLDGVALVLTVFLLLIAVDLLWGLLMAALRRIPIIGH